MGFELIEIENNGIHVALGRWVNIGQRWAWLMLVGVDSLSGALMGVVIIYLICEKKKIRWPLCPL